MSNETKSTLVVFGENREILFANTSKVSNSDDFLQIGKVLELHKKFKKHKNYSHTVSEYTDHNGRTMKIHVGITARLFINEVYKEH